MSEVSLELRTETGAATPARGLLDTTSTGPRVVKALAVLTAGIGAGAILIVVPILHLITTWALPLAGFLACLNILRSKSRIHDITGNCPGCGEVLQLAGGRATFPLREDCPACHRPLFIQPVEA